MQRIQRRRYPARNPFGDKVQVKFRFSVGGKSLTTANSVSQSTFAFNDLAQAETIGVGTPGFTVYPTLFQNYRVTGIKIRFTPMLHAAESSQGPVTAFILGSDGVFMSPNIFNIPEQRWCVYKNLNNWQTGGQTKSLSLYLSTVKVAGADRTTINDDDYTGTCNTASPFYNPVPKQLGAQFGLLNTDGANWPGGVGKLLTTNLISYTYYVTFWGRRSIEN